MMRVNIEPILKAIPAARQEAARHYGVHPYFTRRPANVVRTYIERYSFEGDTVLDPFGGTGVTAIEAFLAGRKAIHNDLNPFANFIAESIADTTLRSTTYLRQAFTRVEDECAERLRKLDEDASSADLLLERLPLPENIRLPKNSDAEYFYEMFTSRQLAGLAMLKQSIDRESEFTVRKLLLLAWSASMAKLNKTFLSAKGRAASRGGSSIFSIYRYKIAKENVELPIWETFKGRFENLLAAKEEVLQIKNFREQQSRGTRTLDSREGFCVMGRDAAKLLDVLAPESIDYIFTDPPYGAFISYLDLSVLWNHWLGFQVDQQTRRQETIVGGETGLSESHYKASLRKSIETCMRLLRPDRWFSIVFQHWDVSYFSTILDTVNECGGELKAAITQTGDVIWSMHKKKNSVSVLAGELILTFYKPALSVWVEKSISKVNRSSNQLSDIFDACLPNGCHSFASEELFNRLVIELWKRGALSCLSLDRQEFARELEVRGWTYCPRSHRWSKQESQQPEPSLFP